ncbi:hypothetical protein JTE90_000970 [Oedothorax gibbosus]|uniref:Uncharacterized protein n=1 Tax=Oedothorax gibbosus TaxID=931172 RepID=A0AAV6VDN7_9ARAC|nr:hypothetical protein JTE90_000970 [Oedothorax gibbosus]
MWSGVCNTTFFTLFHGKCSSETQERPAGWMEEKCVALSHSVISAVRPRSFVSSLLTGVGTYEKFGSRLLVNVLSSLGFSSSYDEVSRFELTAVLHPGASLKKKAFCQFIFDNADFNVNTLNGEGTFHAMGGIFSITPSTSVVLDQNINRVIKCSSEQYLSQIVPVERRAFHKRKICGLEAITIQDIA